MPVANVLEDPGGSNTVNVALALAYEFKARAATAAHRIILALRNPSFPNRPISLQLRTVDFFCM